MKRLLIISVLLTSFTSCNIYVNEAPYDVRDPLVGQYRMEEYSQTYNDFTYYTMRVTKSSYSNIQINMNNFYGANISVYANVSGNKVSIPYQVINGYEIEGVGTISNGSLSMSYRVKIS